MDLYTFFTFVIPTALITFSMDYLSDEQITHSETKLGCLQLFHHLSFLTIIILGTMFSIFTKIKLSVLFVYIFVVIFSLGGLLKNKGRCWVTVLASKMINPNKPHRKFMGGISSLMKKYTRSDEKWAYTDALVSETNKSYFIQSIICIFIIIKFIYF